ncbi:MAG: pantoate--beta-alanine ligase [Ectothiorhodospiraceae bacterium]|jgi:pantoate--beta-alanine ligase
MQIVRHINEMRVHARDWHEQRRQVGFVPTMGNLHAGHLALVEEARERCDHVVVSIFVNPTQFGPSEDYGAYPRTLEEDCAKLEPYGVDVVFAPSVEEMYPDGGGLRTTVDVPGLSDILCGATRPGHFRGVATVVAKLFNIVTPDLAIFGRKDYQQFLVIRLMVRDLNLPVQVVGAPVARAPSGLALSSRNAYLTEQELATAPTLYATLQEAAASLREGRRDFAAIEARGRARLDGAGMKPDYFSVRRRADLGMPEESDSDLVVLAAAYLGRARLIDNLEVPADGE